MYKKGVYLMSHEIIAGRVKRYCKFYRKAINLYVNNRIQMSGGKPIQLKDEEGSVIIQVYNPDTKNYVGLKRDFVKFLDVLSKQNMETGLEVPFEFVQAIHVPDLFAVNLITAEFFLAEQIYFNPDKNAFSISGEIFTLSPQQIDKASKIYLRTNLETTHAMSVDYLSSRRISSGTVHQTMNYFSDFMPMFVRFTNVRSCMMDLDLNKRFISSTYLAQHMHEVPITTLTGGDVRRIDSTQKDIGYVTYTTKKCIHQAFGVFLPDKVLDLAKIYDFYMRFFYGLIPNVEGFPKESDVVWIQTTSERLPARLTNDQYRTLTEGREVYSKYTGLLVHILTHLDALGLKQQDAVSLYEKMRHITYEDLIKL